jgi:hypothetical protein
MNLTNRQMFAIILVLIVIGAGVDVMVFVGSRADANVRLAAVTATTTLAATLIGVVATLMTGKDHSVPNDLPPGSVQQETTTTQTPPITSNPQVPNVPPSPPTISSR